ncbi:MAG TPA: response regulator [Steroidobacteraceae bacterium]
MVTGKRALIVDDSRSARVILSRMLEHHGLAVDTAESAEQALEFLAQGRPDVIFMDHLMPGMDGFQAVQVIKSDPQTATIPLMMYTSQEGELYVSQARALGAVGVLPKTVRPVDVSRVLYQLHLLPDRRQPRSALFEGGASRGLTVVSGDRGEGEDAELAAGQGSEGGAAPAGQFVAPPISLSELQGSLRHSVQQLLKDQLTEQRRFVVATVEAFARRMSSELKDGLSRLPPPPTVELLPPPPPPARWWPIAITALLAAVPAAVLGALLWRALDSNRAAEHEVAELKAHQAEAPAASINPAAAAMVADAASSGTAGPIVVEYLPYGEPPFDGARLERLRALAAMLEPQGFRGRIVAESFVGDFCLSGNAYEGFSVADPDLPLAKCTLVGNPHDDGLSPAQRQSVAFANFTAGLRQRTSGAIVVEVANGGRNNPVQYPEQREGMTAGQWNGVATQNNRVEFRVVPGA